MARKIIPSAAVFAARRRRAAAAVARAKLPALLVTHVADVAYLSGFSGDDSFLLLGGGWAVLITDGRYAEQAADECPGVQLLVRDGSIWDVVAEQVRHRKVRRLAVQGGHLTVAAMGQLTDRLGAAMVHPMREAVSRLRIVKDDDEVRAIVRAIRIAERAFKDLLALGVDGWVGRSERDLAAELEYRMVCRGAEKASFDTIVAAGPHGSLPHYGPDGTVIRAGDAVLVDWGAVAEGYCSDLTRVVLTGRIPPKLAEVYEVVRRAQRAGIKAVSAGRSGKTVDAAARQVIAAAGYQEQFVHSLGHGIGREIHEGPAVSRMNRSRLRAGMIVTIEPGIYLPGVGGVRIEDDVLVTADGATKLSSLPSTMRTMTLRPSR